MLVTNVNFVVDTHLRVTPANRSPYYFDRPTMVTKLSDSKIEFMNQIWERRQIVSSKRCIISRHAHAVVSQRHVRKEWTHNCKATQEAATLRTVGANILCDRFCMMEDRNQQVMR